MTTQSYEDASIMLLRQADDELMAGDFRQAAEKAWGAAAQITKAVCVKRGWSHQSNASLRRANKRMAEELDDKEVRLLFNAAQNLHKNFYEDFYNESEVSLGIRDVGELIEKLRPLA